MHWINQTINEGNNSNFFVSTRMEILLCFISIYTFRRNINLQQKKYNAEQIAKGKLTAVSSVHGNQ